MPYFIAGIVLMIVVGYNLRRAISIKRVPCIDVEKHDQTSQVVDVRDYNNLSTMMNSNSIVIPIPYLKRYSHEIPNKRVHLIAGNRLEKNMGVRLLQKNGFHVTGYSLTECTCTSHSKNMAI